MRRQKLAFLALSTALATTACRPEDRLVDSGDGSLGNGARPSRAAMYDIYPDPNSSLRLRAMSRSQLRWKRECSKSWPVSN